MILMITMILSVILAMAFFTLLERKILAYIQIRKGPNKVSVMGLPQPIADAIKLLMKEWIKPTRSNKWMFSISPMMMLMFALMMWIFIPMKNSMMFFQMTFLMFLMLMSLNVYPTLLSGWISNSKYASIGALRAIAQTISYEITMAIVLLSPLIMCLTFNGNKIVETQNNTSWFFFLMPCMMMVWIITMLAEVNRTPFDLVEGESELVSGFNVEYSSVGFTLIFMAEYTSILLMSLMTTVIYLGGSMLIINNDILLMMKTTMLAILTIWIRGTLPRMRYDSLMKMTWTVLLPLSICYLAMLTMFSIFSIN